MAFYDIIPIIINVLIFSLFGLACSFVCHLIISGLKGSRHNNGPTFISGFGAHHPGGIILSDEERVVMENRNFKREIIISY